MELPDIDLGISKLVLKIFGPTAEYLGNKLQHWTKKRLENANDIFKNAEDILGNKINEKGSVSPKVLKEVINEGTFCDDTLTKKYYGGVLASSRSQIPRDDRGAILLKTISQLSNYQIRMHYAVYQIVRKLYLDCGLSLTREDDRPEMQIFIYMEDYKNLMDFSEKENPRTILQHILYGLRKENVIESFTYGYKGLRIDDNGTSSPGIRIRPSAFGAELFLWAIGQSDLLVDQILKSDCDLPNLGGIELTGNYLRVPKSKITKKKL